MIVINMELPRNCASCGFLKINTTKNYCQCIPDGRYMYDEDKVWMTEQRPNWCPLKELKEQEPQKRSFTVIDKHTGEFPNVRSIARRCKWAKHLIYCDIDQFVIGEDGTLMLTDDCGNVAICPSDRFEVIWDA